MIHCQSNWPKDKQDGKQISDVCLLNYIDEDFDTISLSQQTLMDPTQGM